MNTEFIKLSKWEAIFYMIQLRLGLLNPQLLSSLQVTKWCNTGVDLLASQPVDRFQSSEGAEKALEEIDNFLKTPQGINLGKLNKMEKTSKELQNKFLAYRVKDTLKRIGEVNEMMRKREGR